MALKASKKSKNKQQESPTKKPPPPKPVDSDETSEESDDLDEAEEMKVPVAAKAPTAGQKRKAEEEEDDDSDDDEEDSDEEPPSKQQKAMGQPVPASIKMKAKAAAAEDSDEDEDSEDSDDDDDDEPPAKQQTKPNPKSVKQKKADEEDDDDDDEEEDGDDDDEDSEEEEESGEEDEEEVQEGNKRKKERKEKPSKKQKVEEPVSVFIGNLDKSTTGEKVEKFLKKHGIEVTEIRKVIHKRFGYADLADPSDLGKALALTGKQIDGLEIKVELAKPKNSVSDRKGNETRFRGESNEAILFVKHLADSVEQDDLKELFPSAKEIRMSVNRESGGHRGFAHVVFATADEVDTIIKEQQGQELEGNRLFLDHAGPIKRTPEQRPERGDSKTLIVKNLSWSTDAERLKTFFDGAKEVRIARFPDSNKSKGFGFVEYSSPEEASEAYDNMSGQEIDGRTVYLGFAQPIGSPRGGGGFRGRGGRGGFGGRGGGRGGFGGRGGGRGGFGGRGGPRGRGGRGGRGGNPKARGGIQNYEGKKKKFDSDSD